MGIGAISAVVRDPGGSINLSPHISNNFCVERHQLVMNSIGIRGFVRKTRMTSKTRVSNPQFPNRGRLNLRNLSNAHIQMIDEALATVGEFGEVHLVVNKGRLRFLITQKSYDALKYRPGGISEGK